MGKSSTEKQYTPIIILALVAALVATLGLWASEKFGESGGSDEAAFSGPTSNEHYEWKMITTWPKNFPGLGFAAENFSRYVYQFYVP